MAYTSRNTNTAEVLGFTDEESSVVSGVSYIPDFFRLYVKTKAGTVYAYEGVPLSAYNDFRDAISRGNFWNRRVQGNYGSAGAVFDLPKPTENEAPEEVTEFVVTYKVSGEVEVRVKAADWTEAASKAAEAFDGPGLTKEAVSIKKA